MANVSRPGLWPVGTLSGSPWQGSVREYPVVAGADEIYLGDAVILEADGCVDRLVTFTGAILGACVGVKPVDGQDLGSTTLALAGGTSPALGTKYSTGAGTVLVCTAKDAIYEMDATAAVEGRVNVGQTANLATPRGSNTTGLSAHAVNISQIGVDATGQVRIIDIPTRVDNTVAAANCHVLVVINQHALTAATAGI